MAGKRYRIKSRRTSSAFSSETEPVRYNSPFLSGGSWSGARPAVEDYSLPLVVLFIGTVAAAWLWYALPPWGKRGPVAEAEMQRQVQEMTRQNPNAEVFEVGEGNGPASTPAPEKK